MDLVQEIISKVVAEIGDLANADEQKITEFIYKVMGSYDLSGEDQTSIAAKVKVGVELMKKTLG